MHYVGADLHKEQTWFYVMDQNGIKVLSKSISNRPEVLQQFFHSLSKPFTLAVEATYNWYFFIDIAERFAENVFLANSFELKAFAKRHKKTDKIDARLIADVLRKGFLPTVFIPCPAIRQIKELVHYRMNLVQERCRAIFRLKNVLDKLGLETTGDFTAMRQLHGIPLDSIEPRCRYVMSGYIERIVELSKRLNSMKTDLKNEFQSDPEIQRLITINGLDYFSAALIKSEICDIKRFASFNRLCAYAGLAPSVSQSGNKETRHGALPSNRRKRLQWILLETVYHFIRTSKERTARYEQFKEHKGANTAKIIMARQMLKVIYHVMKEQRPYYRDRPQQLVEQNNEIQSVAAAALNGV